MLNHRPFRLDVLSRGGAEKKTKESGDDGSVEEHIVASVNARLSGVRGADGQVEQVAVLLEVEA